MEPSQEGEALLVERLDSDADATDSDLEQPFEVRDVHAGRVALHGHFQIRRRRKGSPDAGEHPAEVCRVPKGRCSTAEEDGRHLWERTWQSVDASLEFLEYRVSVSRVRQSRPRLHRIRGHPGTRFGDGDAQEVAVRALLQAPREVDVHSDGLRRGLSFLGFHAATWFRLSKT